MLKPGYFLKGAEVKWFDHPDVTKERSPLHDWYSFGLGKSLISMRLDVYSYPKNQTYASLETIDIF